MKLYSLLILTENAIKSKNNFKVPKKSEIVVFPGRIILPCKQNKSEIFSTLHHIFPRIRRKDQINNFQFHHTTREDVLKILKTLNPKKATGCDQILAKLLKHASSQIAPVISNIINKALDEGNFPNILKKAEVIPVYKKSDKLNKSNYRPVSILQILAKDFEKVLAHQITPFLNTVFSRHLSAFRQGYGCQDTLLTLIENWVKIF